MATRKPLIHARQAETAKPEEKSYRLNAGEGLPGGGTQRLQALPLPLCRQGEEPSMGLLPAVGLQEAREARDEARKLVARG